MKLEKENLEHFKDWLNLDLESLTWQGKFEKDFESFWAIFFQSDLEVSLYFDRFETLLKEVKTGPLSSWLKWLRERFICYGFIYCDLSVLQLSRQSKLSISEVAMKLRLYFIDFYPHLEDLFNSKLQITDSIHPNTQLKFSSLKVEAGIGSPEIGSSDEDVLRSLEVTLYDEWKKIVFFVETNFDPLKAPQKNSFLSMSMKSQIRFFRDLAILTSLGIGLIWGINKFNHWQEGFFADRIRVFQPDFLWTNKIFSDVSPNANSQDEIEFDISEIEKLEAQELELRVDSEFGEFEGGESEVALTSLDTMPTGLGGVSFEHSEYEEEKRLSYRDSISGRRLAYRVMVKSPDPLKSKVGINKLLDSFNAEQVDRVKPGTSVPGGLYYNLFVPSKQLSGFLAKVGEVESSIVYQSRTKGRTPPGMNKVFIWIKKI